VPGSMLATGCVFQDNDADSVGGAICHPEGNASKTIDIAYTLFADNDAPEGGILYWWEPSGLANTLTLNVANSILSYATGTAIATAAANNAKLVPSFACIDTLELDQQLLEFGGATCTDCITANPAWCAWSDDDTVNDDFRLRGSSPCYASKTCGHIGPNNWCIAACGDSCWAPTMGGRRYGMRAER